MKNLFFILILFLGACDLTESTDIKPEVPRQETSNDDLKNDENLHVVAKIDEHQLKGEKNDFVAVNFIIDTNYKLPKTIVFFLKVNSNYDFESRFSVQNEDWGISSIKPLEDDNSFIVELSHESPTSIVLEDIVCLAPPYVCNGCDGEAIDCVQFSMYAY